VISQRHATLLNLKKKYLDEINHVRQDTEQQHPRPITGTFYQTSLTSSASNLPSQPRATIIQTSATFIS
jgi:hypothetical protein